MNKHLEKLAHLLLYFGFGVGAYAIYLARYDSVRQFMVLLLLVVFYLVWGFAFHHWKKEATTKLFVEYLIIALIALVAGFLVLMN